MGMISEHLGGEQFSGVQPHDRELTDQWHIKEAMQHQLAAADEHRDIASRWHQNESNRHAREAGLNKTYYGKVSDLKNSAAKGKAYEEGLASPEGKFNEKAKNTYSWWSP